MRHFVGTSIKNVTVRQRGHNEYIKFITPNYNLTGKDIMLKGGKFYAVLNEETGMWSTDEMDVFSKIDNTLYSCRDKISKEDSYGTYRTEDGDEVRVNELCNSQSNELVAYRTWENKLPPNFNYKQLDSKLTFMDEPVKPEDYRSKRLKYKVANGSIDSYNQLMSVLYSPEEREKLEWAIGSIYAGDSVDIEKIIVLYGDPGTGKSTVLDLVKSLFDGYWAPFIASDLARKSDQFATSVFKDNPLLAIQDDGSLAKIESPVINEIVSHKDIIVNEKGKQRYKIKPNAMLWLATNELVDIHDTKLGISRRLLDIYPTGNRLPVAEYRRLVKQLKFEYGAIAKHCLDIYQGLGKEYYLNYSPFQMIKKTNIMQNFMFDNYEKFVANDPITRNVAYDWYKAYFEESGLGYPPKRILFGEQLKTYYQSYDEVKWCDGKTRRHLYSGFKKELVDDTNSVNLANHNEDENNNKDILGMTETNDSVFLNMFKDSPAQLAKGKDDIPSKSWANVTTFLKDLDQTKVHYMQPQAIVPNLVVIDFDLKDSDSNKSYKLNSEAASNWPETYAELSKGGSGIHLHYIYDGDITKLSPIYSDNVEIKTFIGNSALRRKLSKCNNKPIVTLAEGTLPVKGDKKQMINWDGVKDETHLRNIIIKDLKKQSFPSTVQSINHICDVINNASDKGIKYDISDLIPDIKAFAFSSSHHPIECLEKVNKLKYASDSLDESLEALKDQIIFFDVEVFPNLFVLCYKKKDADGVVKLINPSIEVVKDLCCSKLIGFNNRKYDNHILYAWMQGYSNEELYKQSKMIIDVHGGYFNAAYGLSYTDIYDFSVKKQSLKKFEIELGIHHQENHFPWDEPVSEEHWNEIADYCANDVIATEAVFNARYADYEARCILAELSGGTPNDTTNSLTGKLIFGSNKNPQSEFVYTDLSTQFPGYTYKNGISTYMGEKVGEGGYVYSKPGVWSHVVTFDVASMHPHSAIALNVFGDRYTARFRDLVNARIAIKHKDIQALNTIFDGAFKKFTNASDDELKNLAQALKIAINSVYGLTSAKFDNLFKDPRNIDNIVAKRGALFMITLKHEVEKLGAKVIHIKTDSIKIERPSIKVRNYIMEFGKKYGYTFEIEHQYERMCLIDKAVYIARYENYDEDWKKDNDKAISKGLPSPTRWAPTGKQFMEPYVFKTLFSKEEIEFKDLCQEREVKTALYLDMNEHSNNPDNHDYKFVGKVGSFIPIKDGAGGGLLMRKDETGKYSYASSSKGYRWLESESIKGIKNVNDIIDYSYYDNLVDKAKKALLEQCKNEDTLNWFLSGEENPLDSDQLPF